MKSAEIPARMLALEIQDLTLLYNCYMPFLKHGGLFVPSEDTFSLGEDILLSLQIGPQAKRFLPTQVVWINPARTSAQRPKGVGLAFAQHENCFRAKEWIEAELGARLRSDRVTFTL